MRATGAALLCYLGLPLMALFGGELPRPADMKVDFDQHVKPILSKNCHACHGTKQQQSGLRLDKRQNALRGGDYGPVIIAGKSADSKLILRLVSGDGGMQMPPTGPLATEDIGILRAWIDQGAEWGDIELAPPEPRKPLDPKLTASARMSTPRTASMGRRCTGPPGATKRPACCWNAARKSTARPRTAARLCTSPPAAAIATRS